MTRRVDYRVLASASYTVHVHVSSTTYHQTMTSGVAVVAAPGLIISTLPSLSDQPTTFELVGARVVSGRSAGIVITLYRPGSAAVLQSFFDELAAVLDGVATYQEPCTSSVTTTSGSITPSSFVNWSSRTGFYSTTRARRINRAARSTLWSHELTLAAQNRWMSSTSVCPSPAAVVSRRHPPGSTLYCHVLLSLAASGLWISMTSGLCCLCRGSASRTTGQMT